jgi:hypothetical protein
MANLLETIQQNRASLAAQQQGVGDQTQQIQSLLGAKSGKAPTTSDTGISNLGEQSAAATANQGQAQLGQQAAVQTQAENTQAAGIQQDTTNQLASVSQARKFDTLQSRLQTQSVLNNLAQQKGDLSDQKSQAALEQVAFNLSMQDKKYVDTLENIGARRRLDNDVNFKSEMQQIAFGDSLSMLKQKLAEGDVLSASDRDFAKALSDMSIEDALRVAAIQSAGAQSAADLNAAIAGTQAKAAATQANDAAMASAAGQAVTAGVQGYGAYANANTATGPKAPAPTGNISGSDTTDFSNYG